MYEPGSLVAGKYRVEHLLGRGGMGVVVAATHVELRVPVALKFLSDRFAARADIVERFLREARAAAQLHSKHVCRVTDVARLPTGVPFIVMEMLVGRDLAKLLRAEGPLPPWLAASYVAQACDAVAEAHAAGIVHRDLKPGNLFLAQQRDGDALIKVLDFGVAKVETEQDHAITGHEAVIGSPSYMSPEQLRSARAADARSDVWSLGVILHQLATGHPPFRGETIADLAIRAATEPLPPIAGVPPAYAAVIARCLEKQPDARYPSAGALAADLAALARPSLASFATGPQLPPMAPQQPPMLPTETTLRGASGVMNGPANAPSSRRLLVVGAAIAIAIGVSAGVYVHGSAGVPDAAARGSDGSGAVTIMSATAPVAAPPPPDAAIEIAIPIDAAPAEISIEPQPSAPPHATTAPHKPKPRPKPQPVEDVGASRI